MIAERNKAKYEEGSEPRTAPQPASSSSKGQQERQVEANNAKRKPADTEEPGETRSKNQRMACLGGSAKTEESAKSVLEQLIAEEDKSIRAPSTHEVVEGIIDSLNQVCTRKIREELSKTEAAQSGCSVGITKANSPLTMAKMAGTLGYKSGFVLDLTTEDENGKKWDLFRPEDSERNRGEIERGISVVTGSITSFDSVCHDAVAELHKAER